MDPTTVLMVNWAGSYGGAEKYQLNIVRHFDERRYRFVFASPAGDWPQRLAASGYPHCEVPMRRGLDVTSVWRLRRIIAQEKVSIVHAQQSRGLLQAGLAAKLAGRVAVVQTEHNISMGWYKAGIYPWYVRWINNPIRALVARYLADCIITLGQSGKDFYTNVLGLSPDKIAVVPVPHPVFPERLAAIHPYPIIGTPAELTERKGLQYLIAAASLVVKKHPDAQFLILGRGHLEQQLRNEIRQRNLEQNVRLLGFVPDVTARMVEWDMLVLPSLWDPFPQVVLEAMANSLPVVASAVDGIQEMVVDGETGILVPPANPEALAQAILHLIEHPTLAHDLGRKGRERVAQVYSVERVVSLLDAIYQNVLEKRR